MIIDRMLDTDFTLRMKLLPKEELADEKQELLDWINELNSSSDFEKNMIEELRECIEILNRRLK